MPPCWSWKKKQKREKKKKVHRILFLPWITIYSTWRTWSELYKWDLAWNAPIECGPFFFRGSQKANASVERKKRGNEISQKKIPRNKDHEHFRFRRHRPLGERKKRTRVVLQAKKGLCFDNPRCPESVNARSPARLVCTFLYYYPSLMEKCALSKLVGGKTDDWMRDIFQFCCVGSSDLKGQGSSPVSLLQGASEGNGVSLPWFVLQYNLRWGMYVVHIMSSSLFFFFLWGWRSVFNVPSGN